MHRSVLHMEDTASAVFAPDWIGQKTMTGISLVKIGCLNGPTWTVGEMVLFGDMTHHS